MTVSDDGSPALTCLPNEILLQILIAVPTKSLLPLAGVNHRFHSLVLRILYTRLLRAACLSDHSLMLECYHPSARLSEPHFICEYLGTDGLEDACYVDAESAPPGEWLGQLNNLYSRFLPHRREIERKVPRRHPAGDVPGSRTHPATSTNAPAQTGGIAQANPPPQQQSSDASARDCADEEPVKLITQHLHLDSGELFTQLTGATALFKPGPKSGLFRSFKEISRGTIRVWRNWLAEQSMLQAAAEAASRRTDASQPRESAEPEEELDAGRAPMASSSAPGLVEEGPAKQQAGEEKGKARTAAEPEPAARVAKVEPLSKDASILWDNSGSQNVGVRFRVRERRWRHARGPPILAPVDEDAAVSYEIMYEELVVRTSHLLLSMESSLDSPAETSGKAIVFGNWA